LPYQKSKIGSPKLDTNYLVSAQKKARERTFTLSLSRPKEEENVILIHLHNTTIFLFGQVEKPFFLEK
jgi:hypothetical protein